MKQPWATTWIYVLLAAAFVMPAAGQVPAGSEIAVNTYTTAAQDDAAVAMARDGGFVVVWETPSDGAADGIAGRRFDAAGAPAAGEFDVNTTTIGSQDDAHVAMGADGRFVVVWEAPDGTADGIFGQRYDAAGSRLGAEFRVNTNNGGTEYSPFAAVLPGGGFVVTWSVFGSPDPAPDGSEGAVMARIFDAAGSPAGGEFVVNSYTPGYQNFGYVAAGGSGFVIAWESQQVAGSAYDVFAQRFDAAGNRLGGEFQVNSVTTDSQSSYPLAMAPDGRFVILWLGPDGNGSGIFGQRFDAAGVPLGAELQVNSYTTGAQAQATPASDAQFNFVVTWYSVGQDGDGRSVRGQRFDSAGARRGGEFAVSAFTTGNQHDSWVGSDEVGNFVVAWESPQDGSGDGVVARRFGGLFPTALTVDSGPGNFVLEPGETVSVRPTWRNFNGAAQTFSGTLTNITGPAGATYTITDPAGDYGTVANGAIGPCADCYGVSVSNPATRPAQHWDASAVESILPDTQGQQKQWLLHVGRSFTDVPASNGFYRFIETLLHHQITGGCGGTNYCPANSTTREQMAVFVLVAKEGAGYTPPACVPPNMFGDVPETSAFCRFIEELARRGVVTGCGGGNYCPTAPVTREQMAVFVLVTLDRTLNPPACVPPNDFADVPETSPFCRWIEELFRRGVVTGCGGTPPNYCPTNPVTREQMGVFISATFGLTLYGP